MGRKTQPPTGGRGLGAKAGEGRDTGPSVYGVRHRQRWGAVRPKFWEGPSVTGSGFSLYQAPASPRPGGGSNQGGGSTCTCPFPSQMWPWRGPEGLCFPGLRPRAPSSRARLGSGCRGVLVHVVWFPAVLVGTPHREGSRCLLHEPPGLLPLVDGRRVLIVL